MEFKRNKKGQSFGMITGLIIGVASLVIAVIIALIITSTLSDANLTTDSRPSITVLNEEGWLNQTGYSLSSFDTTILGLSISQITNNSASNTSVISSGLYSLNTATGVVTNTTVAEWGNDQTVLINYTYSVRSETETAIDNLTSNFSAGIGEVATKIPTILLVAAILLILGVLTLLIGMWNKMRLGQGGL